MKSRSIIIGLAALAAGVLTSEMASAASAENGKAAFFRYGCWQCHGYEGQGGITGPKLAPNPIPFETLSNFVRTTDRQMPPFRKEVLPDADLADIYAYLQSRPAVPDPKNIRLLDP